MRPSCPRSRPDLLGRACSRPDLQVRHLRCSKLLPLLENPIMTNTRRFLAALGAGLALIWMVPSGGSAAGAFPIQEKDHIAIIGNTLAERMQYDGWLETMLQARFP